MPETETKRREIDGFIYDVKLLDAHRAVPIFRKVSIVIVSGLDALGTNSTALVAALSTGDVSEMALIGKLAIRAANAMLRQLDDAEVRQVIDAFASVTSVDLGSKSPMLSQIFATHFAGRLSSMCKWLAYCVEVNFGDFLEVAREILISAQSKKNASEGEKAATATSPSASPETSTG